MRENWGSIDGFCSGDSINVAPDKYTLFPNKDALPDVFTYNNSPDDVICKLIPVCWYSSISGINCVHPSVVIAHVHHHISAHEITV
jgi:hypothetical protein